MSFGLGITITAIFFGFSGFIVSMLCFRRHRTQQYYLETHSNNINLLEEELSENFDLLKESSIRISNQSRRIAWLETNMRRPPTANKEIAEGVGDVPLRDDHNLNILQRKQKILNLSKRGYDSKTIAADLGLMPGEVELILNLSRHLSSYI